MPVWGRSLSPKRRAVSHPVTPHADGLCRFVRRRMLLGVLSDYELLVELAAKGLARRDSLPMPRSVTTPEAFYDAMARAALDAIELRAILEDLARAEQELNIITDEASTQAENEDAATRLTDEPPVSADVRADRALSDTPWLGGRRS